MYKILKQISMDIKETAKIHGIVEESVFLQYHEKLWKTTNINETKLRRMEFRQLNRYFNKIR